MTRSLGGNMEFLQYKKEKMRLLLHFKAVRIPHNKAKAEEGRKRRLEQTALVAQSISGGTASTL
jgi:hypothetical protein